MKFFEDYSLSIILGSLFLLSWLGQGVFQWQKFVSEQEAHGQPIESTDFRNEFLASTLENWQSEFLQLGSFVILATYFIHKDSPQSRDGDDELKKMVMEIRREVSERSRPAKTNRRRSR